MRKKVAGWLGRSPCSRNARPQKTLVGRAQLGSSHPPLRNSFPAALLDGLFKHPAGVLSVVPVYGPTKFCCAEIIIQ
jgi:hypothetical protein